MRAVLRRRYRWAGPLGSLVKAHTSWSSMSSSFHNADRRTILVLGFLFLNGGLRLCASFSLMVGLRLCAHGPLALLGFFPPHMSMSHQASVGGPRAPQGSLLRLPFDGNTPPSVGRVRAVKSPSFTARFLCFIEQRR